MSLGNKMPDRKTMPTNNIAIFTVRFALWTATMIAVALLATIRRMPYYTAHPDAGVQYFTVNKRQYVIDMSMTAEGWTPTPAPAALHVIFAGGEETADGGHADFDYSRRLWTLRVGQSLPRQVPGLLSLGDVNAMFPNRGIEPLVAADMQTVANNASLLTDVTKLEVTPPLDATIVTVSGRHAFPNVGKTFKFAPRDYVPGWCLAIWAIGLPFVSFRRKSAL